MRKLINGILNICLVSVILIGGYAIYKVLANPCDTPIEYKIGTIDPRFHMSGERFKGDAEKAANIWSSALGKSLFAYNPEASLSVNLMFDYRQQAADLRADIDTRLDSTQSLKEQFNALSKKYQSAKGSYESAAKEFKARVDAYNSSIAYWNGKGGAPADEFNKLNREKADLQAEQNALEKERQELMILADELNAFVKKYNSAIRDINADIHIVNQSAGEFEEGVYDPNTHRIDIFEYPNETALIRVTAHEFGHALGLDHNDNEASIMYAVNKGDSLALSADDVAALKLRCRVKN